MDVRLPDGTVVKNVPDDITKADLTAKLKANGYDVSKLETPAPSRPILPTQPLDPLSRLASAGGEFVSDLINKTAYNVGGRVTDALAPHVSPEVAGGAGYVANVATQAIPVIAGGEIGKLGEPKMVEGARSLLQSALKPTWENLRTGKAAKAITTMLEDGTLLTRGGAAKMQAEISRLNDEIANAVRSSPAVVDKANVWKPVRDALDKFRKQVNPEADMNAVNRAWVEFENHPLLAGRQDIPVRLAQELKQGTYKALGTKSYGELKGAEIEAQKAIARGLKDEVANVVPGVGQWNQRESELLNALSVAERRLLVEANNNPMGLSLLAKNPEAWAAFLADRSGAFKSLLAKVMYQGRTQVPATAGRLGGAVIGFQSGRSD